MSLLSHFIPHRSMSCLYFSDVFSFFFIFHGFVLCIFSYSLFCHCLKNKQTENCEEIKQPLRCVDPHFQSQEPAGNLNRKNMISFFILLSFGEMLRKPANYSKVLET